MQKTKKSLLVSVVALMLCFVMLLGTTYAWFTDSVASSGNIIQSGTLDINMFWSEDAQVWNDAEGENATPVFNYDNWEPGYTEVRYIKVTNEGSLAFQYQMLLSPNGKVGKLAEVIDVSYDIVTDNANFVAPTAQNKAGSLQTVGTLKDIISGNLPVAGGVLLPADKTEEGYYSGEIVVCIAFHMQESAGNEYQNSSIGTSFDINLYATQFDYESDSFGSDYDDEAEWPDLPQKQYTIEEEIPIDENGVLLQTITLTDAEGTVTLTLPEGFKFIPGTTKVKFNLEQMDESDANIETQEGERTKSFDMHIEDVAQDNDKPAEIEVYNIFSKALNQGNYRVYHVENDATVQMGEGREAAHNSFSYDPATGTATFYLASFSEVVLMAMAPAWQGKYDYTWYTSRSNTQSNTYYIFNADQLAAFGAIVGGMNGQKQDSFTGKTVVLMNNINLNDVEEDDKIFYPIGYYYNGDDANPYSTVYSFEGTFNGNGYTITNFYQNTWEIKGDYDGNYYKDAMGLFGYIVNGRVENLTVDHFSSDGEFTPTGVIAAYACNSYFYNIAITNCNPRVYNTGNGGIVGIGGNDSDPDTYKLTFENITIDNTNKITSLWGSWDTACGGLIGMFRGAGYVDMINCHVGAQIDVYNDVCGNYQYYWYRYSGMLIGTNKNMRTDDQGYTVPETDKFEAIGCTVHFGDWNNYYYCELVANSLASYTHDHQFSRLTEIASLSEIKNGDKWTKTGNFLLIEGDTKTCYHIVKDANGNLVQHMHKDAGYEDGIDENNDGENDLKEDKQIVYLPFNQLFTGYGWGVKHVPIYNDENQNPFEGVTILDREQANSVVKFAGRRFNREVMADGTVIKEGILSSPISGRRYKLSHLFNLINEDVRVIEGAITISVTNLDQDGTVTATLLTRDPENWENSELVFSGGGKVLLTIQDYYYCTPTTIEIEVRNYPEGSKVRNFTYDGFANGEDYTFSGQADHITNGKHGVYEFDFGYGPEILEYAHKFDSNGKITFTAPADGIFTIAYASQSAGSGIKYTVDGQTKELDRVDEPFELHIAQVQMQKGKTYAFVRITGECGIYYVAFVPKTAIPNDHTHTYYNESTATCEQGGQMTAMCLVCGYKDRTVNVPALGHDLAYEPGYEETCTDNGKTAGYYCTRCDYIQSGCETIKAHGHNFVNGFCHCSSEACHEPQNVGHVYYKADFTTTSASDYTNYGTNSFFKPHGSCDMSNDKKYLIMKTSSTGEAPYIEFTITEAMNFYVKVTSTGRENVSKFVLKKVANDTVTNINSVFHTDNAEVQVKGVSGHTLVYTLEAGTYRFYCTSTERVGRVMTMTVAEKKDIKTQ